MAATVLPSPYLDEIVAEDKIWLPVQRYGGWHVGKDRSYTGHGILLSTHSWLHKRHTAPQCL